jgi:hypothetical protein
MKSSRSGISLSRPSSPEGSSSRGMRLAEAVRRLLHDIAGEHAGAVAPGRALLACACAHAQALYTFTRNKPDEGESFL